MGIFEKFKIGLSKSSKNFSNGIKNLVINKKIDSKTLDELEDFFIESDVGIVVAKELKQIFSDEKINPEKNTMEQVNLIVESYIKKLISSILELKKIKSYYNIKILKHLILL